MECIYSFLVRSGDSMNGFRVMIDGKVVEGEMQKKDMMMLLHLDMVHIVLKKVHIYLIYLHVI